MNREKRAFWLGVLSVFMGITLCSLFFVNVWCGVFAFLILLVTCDVCDEVNEERGGKKDGSK